MNIKLFFTLLILSIFFSANAQKSIPDIKIEDIEGNRMLLSDINKGNSIVYLTFTGWCGPCTTGLNILNEKYSPEKNIIPIVFLSKSESKNNFKYMSRFMENNHFKLYFSNFTELSKFDTLNDNGKLPFIILSKNNTVLSSKIGLDFKNILNKITIDSLQKDDLFNSKNRINPIQKDDLLKSEFRNHTIIPKIITEIEKLEGRSDIIEYCNEKNITANDIGELIKKQRKYINRWVVNLADNPEAYYRRVMNREIPILRDIIKKLNKIINYISVDTDILSNRMILKILNHREITDWEFDDIIKYRDTVLIEALLQKNPDLLNSKEKDWILWKANKNDDLDKMRYLLKKLNLKFLPYKYANRDESHLANFDFYPLTKKYHTVPKIDLSTNSTIINECDNLKKKIKNQQDNIIQTKLQNIVKGKYEKEADFKKRYLLEKEKILIETNESNIEEENNYCNKNIKVKNYRFDSESRILELNFENGSSIYAHFPISKKVSWWKDKPYLFYKFFNSDNKLYITAEININQNGKVNLLKGHFKLSTIKATFTNKKPEIFNIIKTDQEVLKVYKHIKNRPILVKMGYCNFPEDNLFIYSNKNLLNEYISYINEKNLRYKRETEIKLDYESLKSYKYQSSYSNDTIKGRHLPEPEIIFNKNYPNFNFCNVKNIEYDTESEIFKLTYLKYGVVFVPVPIAEAEKFENYVKTNSFKKITYGFTFIERNKLMLDGLTFTTNDTKKYTLNGKTRDLKITYDAIRPSQYYWEYKDKVVKYHNETLFDNIRPTYKFEVINTQKYMDSIEKVLIQKDKTKSVKFIKEKKKESIENEKKKNEKTLNKYVGTYKGEIKGHKFLVFISILNGKLLWKDNMGSPESFLSRKNNDTFKYDKEGFGIGITFYPNNKYLKLLYNNNIKIKMKKISN